MRIRFNAISDVGCVRTNNEDMALVFGQQLRDDAMTLACELPENVRLTAIVADGMGGYEHGEVASEMATTQFDQFLNALPDGLDQNDLIMAVKKWTQQANADIMRAAAGTGMGCTFCGIFTYADMAYVVNIGDSRTYRLRYDLFKQLTTDHSERARMHDDTIASNLIYNALGVGNAFVDITPMKLVEGDKYLVCSDGLSDMVADEAIERIVRDEADPAPALIAAAKAAGGEDNVTVIVLEIS